jgi:ubiquinone/menaquinone biosynthesis C-methylase UbiE
MPDFKRAVLVGNSTFQALPPLRCPKADVEAMSQVLKDEEICWFSPVHTLLDAPHNEIFTRINEVLRDADKEDLVLIYYSGHGLLDSRGRLYLAANNTDPSLLHATAVSVSGIRDCLSQSRCQRFVLILDCCYAGAATAEFRRNGSAISTDFAAGEAVEGIGEFVLSASTAIQRAEEKQGDALSLLTKHIVEGLERSSADTDNDGLIRLDELYQYVRGKLSGPGQQEPLQWVSGSAASFILGRTPRSRDNRLQQAIRQRFLRPGTREKLPPSIQASLEEMVGMNISDFRTRHNATVWLAYGWARGEIPTDDFIDQWYRLRTDLSGVDRPAEVPMEKRWRIVNAARKAVLDLVGPTYLLDANFHFLDWNPAFDELVAKPLRLLRGTHAENFVIALDNSREVIARAQQKFQEDLGMPLVDCEILRLKTPRHGLVQFRKVAAQIAETSEHGLVWTVNLNIEAAENASLLWEDLHRRLTTEVNWSRYAESYDKMLLHFRAYGELLRQVSGLLSNARHCADLGAGTGNSTLSLLAGHPERLVSAFESNEIMLQHLRAKLIQEEDLNAIRRVAIYKGDLALSLREFPENSFDGALMVNVLYALDDPDRCLAEVFRVLQPNACLALSTSHSQTNVGALFAAIRADLDAQGLLGQLRSAVEDAEDRHQQMLRNIKRDTREQVIQYLERAGFEIAERIDSAYADAVMIVQARKPVPKAVVVETTLQEPPTTRDQVFISYSHQDREWLKRLQVFLTPAFRSGRLKLWDDTNLRIGDSWRAEIQAAIARARVAILLVSPNFLASQFIADDEFPRILEAARRDGLTIVWLLLSSAPYEMAAVGQVIREIQCAHPVDKPLDMLGEPERNLIFTNFVRQLVDMFPGSDTAILRK